MTNAAPEEADCFVLSGYPRHSADLVDYLGRVGRVDGAILLNWHDEALEAQIEYGAKEGRIKLAEAKDELRHFKRHVIPVAEFFDFKELLYVVSRESTDVDFEKWTIAFY